MTSACPMYGNLKVWSHLISSAQPYLILIRFIMLEKGIGLQQRVFYDPSYAWVLYTDDGNVGVGFKEKAEFCVLPVRS